MVHHCSVFGCSNRSSKPECKGMSFFRIVSVISHQGEETKTRSEKRRQTWLNRIKRENFTATKHSRICSEHFITGKPAKLYENTHPDWAPSLKLGYSNSLDKLNLSRFNRIGERKEKKKDVEAAHSLLGLFSFNNNPADVFADEDFLSGLLDDEVEDITPTTTEAEGTSTCATQTDPPLDSPEMIELMKEELQKLRTENILLKDKLEGSKITRNSLSKDDDQVRFYTGLPSFLTLMTVFEIAEPYLRNSTKTSLTKFQKVVITLMKLRLNTPLQDLAYRFSVAQSTISNIFRTVINILYHRLGGLIKWPSREILQNTMPMDFRKNFGVKVVVIVDCFEIFIDRPSNLLARAQTWSQYKHNNTVKFLIGIAPQGSITFISKAWGGRTSDKFVTEHSGLLDKLLPGDNVLADRGFDIADSVGLMCAELAIPAFTKGKKQLSPTDVEDTRKIANVRIHVERVIGNVRIKYNILNGPLPIDFLQSDQHNQPLVDKIVTVTCALTNLCNSVVPFN